MQLRSATVLLSLIGVTLAGASASSTATPVAESFDADAGVEAIWLVQSFPFEYRGDYTYYDCARFEDKVRVILRALGARYEIAVETRCAGKMRNRISAHITLVTPVPATEENIRAATSFDSHDELIAQLRNVTLPTARDIDRFSAQWQTLSLARIPGAFLAGDDCELLRSVVEQVFPRLAVRIVKNKLRCDGSAVGTRPNLEIEALVISDTAESSDRSASQR